HPAHGPVSLDRLHQISEILSKAAAQSDGGNLGYAMADAVKVIDGAIAAFDAEPDYDIHRDANRYRFLRDKDAFGDEGAQGLASWDDLAELDMGDFDSAVDARLLSCEMPQHILTEAHERTATAGVYAELYRLREEIKGPAGFDTWKDAAIAERKARVELEKAGPRFGDIDYLGAMAAFHSDEWHKMGPITGYMNGWNACRAAMLQVGNSPVSPDGWVACSERMPDSNCLYLCWGTYFQGDEPDYIPAYFFAHQTNGWTEWQPVEDDCNPRDVIITHWLPLPAAPKGEHRDA
ncbi:DUF551 domain-containing protein, partial [Citrobacter freundii]